MNVESEVGTGDTTSFRGIRVKREGSEVDFKNHHPYTGIVQSIEDVRPVTSSSGSAGSHLESEHHLVSQATGRSGSSDGRDAVKREAAIRMSRIPEYVPGSDA